MDDSLQLNPAQALNALFNIVSQLSKLVMWLTFVCFHVALITASLAALWYFQVSPAELAASLGSASRSVIAGKIGVVAGLAGLSALGLLVAYVKIWRKIYAHFYSRFLTATVPVSGR